MNDLASRFAEVSMKSVTQGHQIQDLKMAAIKDKAEVKQYKGYTEKLREQRHQLQAGNDRLRAELDEVTGAAFFHGDTHIEIAHCDDGTLVTRFCQHNQHEDFLRTDGSWVKYVGGSTHFKSYRAARDAFDKWKESDNAE